MMNTPTTTDDPNLDALAPAPDAIEVDSDDFPEFAYDAELEDTLRVAETQTAVHPDLRSLPRLESPADRKGPATGQLPATVELAGETIGETIPDIEHAPAPSPFAQFRKKGFLSVSDLVGTVWCEVQYDYRLRTLPFLPPAQRPAVITTTKGREIVVDKVKVEGKERILRRGQKIHKRLEREIHQEEITVQAVTREDVWGLRFLNMLSALEALLTLGKCRELPVVGVIRGMLIMGIIDEVTRIPVDAKAAERKTRSARQTSLTAFFSPTKPKAAAPAARTHRLFVSDSKTRASGTLPREADTTAGKLQVMLYKELLDAILLAAPARPAQAGVEGQNVAGAGTALLPTLTPFRWSTIFDMLALDPAAPFSDQFIAQSRPVALGNALRWGAGDAASLDDMVAVWERYVAALGLGARAQTAGSEGDGRTDDRLELVYRRAGGRKKARNGKGEQKRKRGRRVQPAGDDEDQQIQIAIEKSLQEKGRPDIIGAAAVASAHDAESDSTPTNAMLEPASTAPTSLTDTDEKTRRDDDADYWGSDKSDVDKEEDELAWAVEMSLGATNEVAANDTLAVALRSSQLSPQEAAACALPAPQGSVPISQASTPASSPASSQPATKSAPSSPELQPVAAAGDTAGSIIGRSVFKHDPARLEAHLDSVLGYWRGERAPRGVDVHEANRCAWCEFEDGCEWRTMKAAEAMQRYRQRMT
ncbi:hypothetical protein Q5752_006049 [Cryptotrichosporon argae]